MEAVILDLRVRIWDCRFDKTSVSPSTSLRTASVALIIDY